MNVNFFSLILVFILNSCLAKVEKKPEEFEVSLYSGITGKIELGQDYNEIAAMKFGKVLELAINRELQAINVGKILFFSEQGVTVFFKNNKVSLLEMMQPFQGKIMGKDFGVFGKLARLKDMGWTDTLVKHLGAYEVKMSGGVLGAEGLFYSWGDIVYNNMGPIQLAIYREPSIAKYRKANFGQDVQLIRSM